MTVAIATVCETSQVIVTASDRLLSYGHASAAEGALKAVRLQTPHWLAMIAGDDITIGVEAVTTSVRETMAALGKPPSALEVSQVLLGAWRDVQNRRAESIVLAPFRMTVQEFTQHGLKRFGEAKFLELAQQIQDASRLQCDLLVAGFDHNARPVLMYCADGVGCQEFTRAGFLAIGSGAHAALSSLAFHRYDTMCDLNTAIYRVCAAKFMAEEVRAAGVGRETVVICLRANGETKWLFKSAIDPIRQLWEREGQPRIPKAEDITKTVGSIEQQLEWNKP